MLYTLEVCEPFQELVQRLPGRGDGRPILIGVDGRAGSGKTIFSQLLAAHLARSGGRVVRLRYDAFWLYGQEFHNLLAALPELAVDPPEPTDYDYAWTLCRDWLLAPLRAGQAPDPRQRRLIEGCCADPPLGDLGAADWVILEGTTCLRRELRPSYDLSLLLRLDPQTCLQQWLAREKGVGADYFVDVWMPLEARYIAEHQPEAVADFLVDTLPARSAFRLIAGG